MDLYFLFVDLLKEDRMDVTAESVACSDAVKKMYKTHSLLYMTVYGPKCSYDIGAS